MLEVREALDGGRSFRTVEELARAIEKRRHDPLLPVRQTSLSGEHLRKIIGEMERLLLNGTDTIIEREHGRPDNPVQASEEGGWRLPQESDEHAKSEAVFDVMRELLIILSQFRQKRQSCCLQVGGSHATEWLVEKAIGRFHRERAGGAQRYGTKCDVVINHGKSHELRRDGTSGKYHIVVASCADLSLRQQGRVSIGAAHVDLHLLIHRRSKLAKKNDVCWSDLAGWTLIVPSPDRWPSPSLPPQIFNHEFRLVTAEHYRDALASVRASGDNERMACIAPARLHSPRELRHLRAYTLPELKSLLLIGAFKSSVRYRREGKTTQLLIDELSKAILAELQLLSGLGIDGCLDRSFPRHALATFHVKRTFSPKGTQQLVWTPGYIANLGLKPSGQFEADHVFYDQQIDGTIRTCPLIGEVLRTQGGTLQLSWTGQMRHEAACENNHCSFLFDQNATFYERPIVGFWAGVSTSFTKPDIGCFLLYPDNRDPLESVERPTQLLNQMVEEYVSNQILSGVKLAMPEEDPSDAWLRDALPALSQYLSKDNVDSPLPTVMR
jgi:hypothetical protein